MTLNEYQDSAMRTASGSCSDNFDLLLNGAMGLNGEAGEVIDIVKKHMFQGHKLDLNHTAKELGDALWYLAVAAKGIGYDLDDIAKINVEKLQKRYPNGFDSEKSQKRKKGDI